MEKYESIVVGAGTAGCLAAKTLATAGFKVCILDQKEMSRIGAKVCGDAIGKHHFDNLGIRYPRGDELDGEVEGVKIYSPDRETVFKISGEGLTGFMVNRHAFGQRLLMDALDSGAILLDSTRVLEPIVKDGFVKGVRARRLDNGSKIEIGGDVTVDASGVYAAVRTKLPPEIGVPLSVPREDLVVCYREIRKVEGQDMEAGFLEIYLNQEVSPGGYYWIFPKKDFKVNVGLGVAAVKGYPNPKTNLQKFVISMPLFKGSKLLDGGGGCVPTRRPLDSFVGNGVVVIGDAACQVNPIHGGGMGPSMMGGKIAAEVISESLQDGCPSLEKLWSINVRYMRTYGAKQAGLDVFRLFLQGLSNEDLNHGMRCRLIKEDDVLSASMGENIRLNITEAARRIFQGLGRPSLLVKLRKMAEESKKARELYLEYPEDPSGLPSWKMEVSRIFFR
ncbi:MAG: NAD(P)/FAD-dependent oxidoreductase [Nitrososphaerota archaeon]|nr:NAD(P)/FAD-dependent oxidoreductase [Candidatus Bathyarchaeota archaeon]MDW8049350.1 NAD(P)/FAD-dependent oxidoreductase [Nitrososphaerota archaeon]